MHMYPHNHLHHRASRWIAPLLLIAVLIALLLVTPTPSVLGEQAVQAATEATIIYVDLDAIGGANDGTSWDDAFTELQPALDAAVAGDEIWVAEGAHHPTAEHGGAGDRYRSFQMKNGVAIYGGFDPSVGDTAWEERDWVFNETVLSGDIGIEGDPTDNCYHVFYHPAGMDLDNTATLDGFTITSGNANGVSPHIDGGGMYNEGSSPTLVNCTFSENSAAQFGAGMHNYNSSSPVLVECAFEGNSAGKGGGGISNYDASSPELTNCTFTSNWAGQYGGGMRNGSGSSPALTNCSFSGNSAPSGGGLFNSNVSSPMLVNCTFWENSADYGGGMANGYSSSPVLTNCTFAGNSAGYSGGGIYNGGSSPVLTNSILWANSPDQISNDSSSPVVTYSDVQDGYTGVGNIDSDPVFVDPGNGGLHLVPGSPCIDAGDNGADNLPTFDFEGDDRIVDGDGNGTATVDMGVDEVTIQTDCQARINDDAAVYTDVQSAVDAAAEGDLVKVAGYCAGVQSRAGMGQTVYLSKTLTIQGGYTTTNWIISDPESNPTTLDALGQGRVLYITGEISPTIEGLHITGGDAYDGGGIYIYLASATIRNSLVHDNTASDWAAGISLQASNAVLSDNVISDNTCFGGGAGGLGLKYSDATLTGNVLSSNEALLSGGAMYLDYSDAEIRGNILQANGAHNAVFLWHSDAILDANVITGSHMGVFMHASGSVMTNNVIAGNSESGVVAEGAWPRLVHNTLAENLYGLRVTDRWQDGSYYTSTVVLTNTIFADNTSGVIVGSGNEVSLEGTLWYGNSSNWSGDGTITSGTVNIFDDPEFVDAGSGDYHIQATSAAIDAGVDSGLVEDIDGDVRPQGGGYDIGADETTSAGLGTLNLAVDLQGRADDSGTLFTAWSGGEEVGHCTSDSAGVCSITSLPAGVYSVTAEMASYLDSAWDSASIGEGESVTLPAVLLPGGDTNDDCVINIQDLSFMGYRFNACAGDPLYDLRGDINGDDCINILDLVMAGSNFNQTCPVPW